MVLVCVTLEQLVCQLVDDSAATILILNTSMRKLEINFKDAP